MIAREGGGGAAAQFDGQDDLVWLPSEAVDGLNDFTVETWIKSDPSVTSRFWLSGARSSQNNELAMRRSGEHISIYVQGDARTTSGTSLVADQWYHVALTRSGSVVRAYVDGDLQLLWPDAPMAALRIDANGLWLGGDQDSVGGGWEQDQQWGGQLDEVRVWNVARERDDIRATMFARLDGVEPGLVAYWSFDGDGAQVIADSSTNGYDGYAGVQEDVPDASDPSWVISTAPMYQGPWTLVTHPNWNEHFYAGQPVTITWVSAAEIENVAIDYSTNGGVDWIGIVGSVDNDGSYEWTVPDTPTTNGLVKVADASDSEAFDIGNAPFIIRAPGTYYVDDNALNDPAPGDPDVSDANEDGSSAHPFDAIQEAIDGAIYGDVIIVLPGTYYENIAFNGFPITVTGSDPNDPPVIDGTHSGSVITFTEGENSETVLAGLTITGGRADYGGESTATDHHRRLKAA